MINSIGNSAVYNYGASNFNGGSTGAKNASTNSASANSASTNSASANSASVPILAEASKPSQSELMAMKRAGVVECATCASRTYQDGSDENVSYKSAAHIDPSSSGSKVMAHEQEHVSNAYSKAAKSGGQVISASVTIRSAVCPECGRSYISGGVTNTTIKYNEKNPYGGNQKSADYATVAGMNVDVGV